MKIKILGTRGEIEASAPYHSRHSGLLIDGELLLDLGEREFLRYEPGRVLLTHLHPDHAFFMRPAEKAAIDIPMFAPEPYRANGIMVSKLGGRRDMGGYAVRPIPTIHSHRLESQAYLVEYGGRRVLYTGDLIWIKKWYTRYFKNLDLVITEASFMRKEGMVRRNEESGKIYGHAGVPRLVEYFSRYSDTIVLVHFGSWFYRNNREAHKKIDQLARQHDVDIRAGYDGLELTV
jgi:ribonuclease BN (tRNA processing enzyme)